MDTADRFLAEGDWNTSAGELDDLVAARTNGDVFPGSGPDHSIARGVELVRSRVLPKGRYADHHPILRVFRVDGILFKTLVWNVHQGTSPAAVAARLEHLIARFRPDVITLNEAYSCRKALRGIDGYRLRQGRNIGEGADVAKLIRRDLKVTHTGVVTMRKPWMVVRYARWRAARVYRRDRIRLAPGVHLRHLGVHLPTNAPVNVPARRESIDQIVEWANRPDKKESQ